MKIKLPLLITVMTLAMASCEKCRVCSCPSATAMVEYEYCNTGKKDERKEWEQDLRAICPDIECKDER